MDRKCIYLDQLEWGYSVVVSLFGSVRMPQFRILKYFQGLHTSELGLWCMDQNQVGQETLVVKQWKLQPAEWQLPKRRTRSSENA